MVPVPFRGILGACLHEEHPHIVFVSRAPLILTILLALSGAVACGSNGDGKTAASLTASAEQRLQGNWRLATFEPFLAMEPPLKGLLQAQLNAMSITFEDGQYTAMGPGVTTGGSYAVMSAQGDTLIGRVYDRAGAGYNVTATFAGPRLEFTSEDSPWSGRGVLERER
jgi:hypothetical protein